MREDHLMKTLQKHGSGRMAGVAAACKFDTAKRDSGTGRNRAAGRRRQDDPVRNNACEPRGAGNRLRTAAVLLALSAGSCGAPARHTKAGSGSG
jgi:hypothetical protein